MEEYLTAKVIEVCQIPYNMAKTIVIDLECRELEEELFVNIQNGLIENCEDLFHMFY